jgi:hypothetical protein
VDAGGIDQEPVPPQLVRPIVEGARVVGAVRLPLAGPYRPWARLLRRPDGRLVWLVRLWHGDRPVPRLVETRVLWAFAAENRLPRLAAEIEALLERAAQEGER